MLVYFNKIKLDRTSFLLTKSLAGAPVTRTERGIKDNFSKFFLKRILPRITVGFFFLLMGNLSLLLIVHSGRVKLQYCFRAE